MLRAIQKKWKAFAADEKGSVLIAIAAGGIMLIAATGLAVDMARAQILQTKMSSALDAAGLAAGATANTYPSGTTQPAWIQSQAQKYFNANFATGYLASSPVTVTATLSDDKNTITLSAGTIQTTSFISAVGIKNVAVGANSIITRASTGMELVLVLDNTGSMADPVNSANSSTAKIDALKTAITGSGGLLDILYGSKSTITDLWVGVVPFTDMVNLGSAHSSWLDATTDATYDFGLTIANPCPSYTGATTQYFAAVTGRNPQPARCSFKLSGTSQSTFNQTKWGGCITSRSSTTASPTDATLTLDDSDDYPTSGNKLFAMFYYPSTDTSLASSDCTSGTNPWRCFSTSGTGANKKTTTLYRDQSFTTYGPNLGCIASPILPMVAEKSSIATEVNNMTANGATMINLGLSWGYRMLSPSWKGHWGGEMDSTGNLQFPQLPLPYGTNLMNKVVILMTDGVNSNADNSAYIGQSTPSNATLDTKTLSICTAMKRAPHNIIIYTIGFGSGSDVNTDLLSKCATDSSHYFLAPTNADLNKAFSQIGDSLANLRISQ